jgi:glycosyltransferase involved in cell wall biosynthesis
MRIVYDGKIFSMQKAGGINRYFAEVIRHLPVAWEPLIVGTSYLGANAPVHEKLRTKSGPSFRPRRISRELMHLRSRFDLRSASLLHPTYYSLLDQIELTAVRCPIVLTVYDMVYAHFASVMEGAATFLKIQREAILRADHIVCISRSTERDLLNLIPQVAGKTTVIYLASSFTSTASSTRSDRVTPPSFLYVGGRATYKNFPFLLRAFARAAKSLPKIRLRVAGAPLAEHERWQLHSLGISHLVELHVFPEEQELEELYRTSVALLYPSLHEGFGIPPLEAMTCETVAVTANTTSLPEVVGTGGIMLDPTDEDQWVETILHLAKGNSDRDALIARGLAQAARFSWKTTGEEHVQLYRKLGCVS